MATQQQTLLDYQSGKITADQYNAYAKTGVIPSATVPPMATTPTPTANSSQTLAGEYQYGSPLTGYFKNYEEAVSASQATKPAVSSVATTTPITNETPDITNQEQDNQSYLDSIAKQLTESRAALETTYQDQIKSLKEQQDKAQAKMDEYKAKEEGALGSMETLSQPYQQALETSGRERLKVEENYFANQKSVKELEDLLNQSLADIQKAEGVTGLSAIRTPTINKIKSDYEARAGILNAVMAARNNQISVATNLIDRSINAIANDRNTQLNYYKDVMTFYDSLRTEEGNKLISLTKDEKQYVNAQIGLVQNDLDRAQATADYIKELMIDPASAQAMESAGITLNDSVSQINAKLATYSYTKEIQDVDNTMATNGYKAILPQQVGSYSSDEVIELTDSKGNKKYYWRQAEAGTTTPKTMNIGGMPYIWDDDSGQFVPVPVEQQEITPEIIRKSLLGLKLEEKTLDQARAFVTMQGFEPDEFIEAEKIKENWWSTSAEHEIGEWSVKEPSNYTPYQF